ncbi:MAG: hypothetical protein LBD22_05145 [Spirochaetaceae bacterium]|jgi:diacylglycerol kinase family enzyme|nr:hypothetical protein [Spirochaetaceae bacterium]
MKHFFVVNPKPLLLQKNFDQVLARIEAACTSLGADNYEIYVSRYPRDAVGVIQEKHKQMGGDALRVYAVGGDGILFDCLNGVAGTNFELTAIPYGAANDYLRNFGEDTPLQCREFAVLNDGVIVNVDMFSCNLNYALNYCAVGIDGAGALLGNNFYTIVKSSLPLICNYLRHCYELGTFVSFFNREVREQHYILTIDDIDYSGNYAGIFIANGACFSCNKISSHHAKPSSGHLNVILAKSAPAAVTALRWGAFQQGKSSRHPEQFREIRASRISIQSDTAALHVCLDGEAFRESHLELEVHPAAVPFAIPNSIAQGGTL